VEVASSPLLQRFWTRLAGARHRILFLDYDGTLAPFTVRRELALPYPGVREALEGIIVTRCRVVMVTGRPSRELLRLLDLSRPPDVWGAHGLERLTPDGRLERIPLKDGVNKGLKAALERAQETGYGQRLEQKYGCLALHWRGMDPAEIRAIEKATERRWSMLANGSGLELRRFDGGLELRAAGHGKGDVVRAVLSEEEGDAVAACLGDDMTDEDAFRAVKGRGVALLVRPEWRQTEADAWIRPPDELLEFLHHWRDICNDER